MKKLLLSLLLIPCVAHASPWDLVQGQYDATGGTIIPRLLPLPSSGTVDGVIVYDQASNLPKLVPFSGCALSSGTFTCTGTSTGTVTSVGVTSSTLTVSGSPVTGSGSITINTPARTQSAQTRTLNSGYQISSTKDALVSYSVQMTVTASIGGGQDGDLFLDIASDSGFTTNLQTLAVAPCSQTYTLAVALQGVQKCPLNVSGYVPAAYYTRLRTVNNSGTPAYVYRAGQEVLL